MNIINMPCNRGNYSSRNGTAIKYIVMHYTGAVSTAKNNGTYFANNGNIQASAHYFVDENCIVASVPESAKAWHSGVDYSGGKAPYHGKCANSNSIGIEMCCVKINGKWAIKTETVNNAVALVKSLMAKYGIDAAHVVRHYDVCWKQCPEPWVRDNKQWTDFKARLTSQEDDEMVTYKTVKEMPEKYRAAIQELVDMKVLNGYGDERGLGLTEEGTRILVIAYRLVKALISTQAETGVKMSEADIIKIFKDHVKIALEVE